MATSTYTQTDGTPAGNKYFQDVEISPATLKSGELVKRFDTLGYPRVGKKVDTVRGAATVTLTLSPASPGAGVDITFTATVVAGTRGSKPTGTVTFKRGATVIQANVQVNASGVATYVLTGGLVAGSYSFTATYNGDPRVPAETSAAVAKTLA